MRTSNRQIRFLEAKEIRKIIDIIPDDLRGRRDRALLEVLFSTGLRISEALALNRHEIIREAGNKTVEITIIGKGGWQRVVYISPVAIKAILRYVAGRDDEDDRLFMITPRRAQKMVKERAKQAGVEKHITPHIFRHSLATDLLRKGVDIRFVSEFLGHKSLNNTMIYTHVVNEQLKKIHEKLYK